MFDGLSIVRGLGLCSVRKRIVGVKRLFAILAAKFFVVVSLTADFKIVRFTVTLCAYVESFRDKERMESSPGQVRSVMRCLYIKRTFMLVAGNLLSTESTLLSMVFSLWN